MGPTIEGEALSPRMGGGNRLAQRPVLSSILIAILAGLLLRISNITGFPQLVESFLPDRYVGVRLIDFGFRMTMGALLVLVGIPLLLGYYRRGWLSEYWRLMRLSMGAQPRKTATAGLHGSRAPSGTVCGPRVPRRVRPAHCRRRNCLGAVSHSELGEQMVDELAADPASQ